MKIKIFCTNDIGKLENAVNEFIAKKDVIDIKFTTAFVNEQYNGCGIPTRSTFYDRVMVMYDDREDQEDWEL